MRHLTESFFEDQDMENRNTSLMDSNNLWELDFIDSIVNQHQQEPISESRNNKQSVLLSKITRNWNNSATKLINESYDVMDGQEEPQIY